MSSPSHPHSQADQELFFFFRHLPKRCLSKRLPYSQSPPLTCNGNYETSSYFSAVCQIVFTNGSLPLHLEIRVTNPPYDVHAILTPGNRQLLAECTAILSTSVSAHYFCHSVGSGALSVSHLKEAILFFISLEGLKCILLCQYEDYDTHLHQMGTSTKEAHKRHTDYKEDTLTFKMPCPKFIPVSSLDRLRSFFQEAGVLGIAELYLPAFCPSMITNPSSFQPLVNF